MEMKTFKSDFILLAVASIWGMAFVAQRMGMDHVGPFTFNGIRFALGGLSLLPFLSASVKREKARGRTADVPGAAELWLCGGITGVVLFAGASLQQVGLVYTTAGKAGFITGLYVIIVPLLGLLRSQKTNTGTWIGAVCAAVGLYFLSVTEAMTISYGDFLELIGAFFFAVHVILIGRFSRRIDTVRLSLIQCLVCCVASLITAVSIETMTVQGIREAALPIVYGGVFSVGIAYSLQIYGQKTSHPAHAAILLSLESLVAALGGWLVLHEILSGRAIFGCILMMGGMIISQIYTYLFPLRVAADS